MDSEMLKTDEVRVLRVDNHFHSETDPAIKTPIGEMWLARGKLHRYRKPAVTMGKTTLYCWRGIRLTKQMAMSELTLHEIIAIRNIEQRQASIELYGYERMFSVAKELDRWTHPQWIEKYPIDSNPMYILYEIPEPEEDSKTFQQPIRVLSMCDPSKVPIIRYAIRVEPTATDCLSAVAKSYGITTKEYLNTRSWV